MKICTKCKKDKSISEFSKDKNSLDGMCYYCKDCAKEYHKNNKEKIAKQRKEHYEQNKEKQAKIAKEYYDNNKAKIAKQTKEYQIKNKDKLNQYKKDRHKKYPWIKTLERIKQRCNNPKNPRYKNYGGRGIRCMITLEELEFLYNRDNAWEMKKPSIDRIENDGYYELSNCQYIELVDNVKKENENRRAKLGLNSN